MKLSGTIERLFFHNDTKAIGTLELEGDSLFLNFNENIHGRSVKFVANVYKPTVGMKLELEGDFEESKYGPQFVAKTATVSLEDENSMMSILTSGFIKGIGPALAAKIVGKFGKNTKKIIENDWNRLVEISGISPAKAVSIHTAFKDSAQFFELLAFFGGQATDHQIAAIYEEFGKDSVNVIKKNPYKLIKIDGFGFKRVDALACKMGLDKNDPKRVNAAIIHALKTIGDEGDCYCPLDSLAGKIRELIDDIVLKDEVFVDELLALVKSKDITIVDETKVYLQQLYFCEKSCADFVKDHLGVPERFYNAIRVDKSLDETEDKLGLELEGKQRRAVHESLKNSFSVITGGPGTGKTTVINALIDAFESCGGNRGDVVLMAPTGRASRRMKEATQLEASTIHAFRASIKVRENAVDRFSRRKVMFIIDESSMIDITVGQMLFDCISMCKRKADKVWVVMIGDIDQLPPIGPGNLFRDLVQSPKVPTTMLEFSHRFGGAIASNSTKVKRGEGINAFVYDSSFNLTSTKKEDTCDAVVNAYIEAIKKYPQKEVQIIVPMKKRSYTAANDLNEIIKSKVNPPREDSPEFEVGNRSFRLNDRVMQTSNRKDLDVFNGDCGTVVGISNVLEVLLDDGRTITYSRNDAMTLTLAFAITIHKSQGSEYAVVITAFTKEHYVMLQRNLLYTAFTRAKKELKVFCDPVAINMAIGNNPAISRNTDFKKQLI